MTRCMPKFIKMPNKFCVEVVVYVVYLSNHYQISKNKPFKNHRMERLLEAITYESLWGIAYAQMAQQERFMFDNQIIEYVFVGYDSHYKGNKLYNHSMTYTTKKILNYQQKVGTHIL